MDSISEKVEITEANIEEMSRLAEDVMHQLYMNYYDYDADGRDIFEKNFDMKGDFNQDIPSLIRAEKEALLKDPNGHLLYDLFRRGDTISYVRWYTKEDIIPLVEPILPKALHLFRRGTNSCGDTNYKAGESVPDEYLIAAFAREVRNMMMIFAGQRLLKEGGSRYLLLLEHPACHDGDEWRGIYFDDENLRRAYERASAELEERKKNDASYRSFHVGIWEFRQVIEYDHKAFGEEKERFRDEIIKESQEIREVKPEELRCFREK